MKFLKRFGGVGLTLLMVAIACFLGLGLYHAYMLSPWTRDGRVFAEVANIAPEVSGTIVEIDVADNQLVHKGDVLYRIDPTRFQLALAQAEAQLKGQHEQLLLQQSDAKRRKGLTGIVSADEQERYADNANVAEAAYQAAMVARDVAKLNLDRSVIYAPVNGYMTNFRLRAGSYAVEGHDTASIIDSDSFFITGYFEETKLARVHVGDKAQIRLMGFAAPIQGHVESVASGISDANDTPDTRGLQQVNPVFTWVRLSQRIPVRVHIDAVPDGVTLAAGMTCSIAVGRQSDGPLTKLVWWSQDRW